MRALIVESGQAEVRDVAKPVPEKGEVLVQVRLAGICGTDLEILKGYSQFQGILGHEFVGRVIAGSSRLEGKRIVAEINCVCGRCDMCASGLSNHCRRRGVVGIVDRPGVFAEFVALPEHNCHVVPDTVTEEEAVFTEPLAAAYQVTRHIKLEPRMSVAVLGTGRLGLLVAQVLAQTGCRLVAIGRNPLTLDWLDRRRIRHAAVGDVRGAADQDVIVDCTGSPEGLPLAMKLVRPRGTIIMKTTCQAPVGLDLAPLVVNEITLLGSRCGSFGDALNALARRQIDVAGMITARRPLSDGVAALGLAQRPDQIKVFLDATA